MLYLVHPSTQVKWNELPAKVTIGAATEHGADLGRLEWRPAEEVALTDDLVRIALSQGTACSVGIVLDGGLVSQVTRPARLIRTFSESTEELRHIKGSPSMQANEQLLEALMPGWKARDEQGGAELQRSLEESVREAIQDAELLLSAPLSDDLVAHWTSLGGVAP